jgi:putative PEP-CTERM system histidine kinase
MHYKALMDSAAFSYDLAALAFAILLVMALTRWRARVSGSWLTPALILQVLWALVVAHVPPVPESNSRPLMLVELLRDTAWVVVLARCLARDDAGRRRAAIVFAGAICIGWLAWFGAQALFSGLLEPMWLLRMRMWAGLLLPILGLVLVEQVARNMRVGRAWNLKYLWLGIGCLFTYDLCLWSVALLNGTIDPNLWSARGLVNALISVVLAAAVSRLPAWNSAAFLSPRLIFFNTTLVGAGIYVLAMAGASALIRAYGGPSGAALQTVFGAAAAIVLAIALFSEQTRAWLRVTVAKHLFPYQHDFRAEWLRLTRALSESSEVPLRERVARVMASFVHSPTAGLWLLDSDGSYAPAGGDLAGPTRPRAEQNEFFEHLRKLEWICDLKQIRAEGPGDKPKPPAWLMDDPKAWLVVPLVCEESLIGFVVIGEPLAAMRIGWEQLDLLRASGRQVASYLAFEQTAQRLAELGQFEAFNRISAFLMHDLRHLIAQQALVVENAVRHRHNPAFIDDAIVTIEHSVKRMTRLMEQLRSARLTEAPRRTDVAEICFEAVERCRNREPVPQLGAVERRLETLVSPERLLHILEHVLRNAQDATPKEGSITLNLRCESQRVIIEVADTGAGMDDEFIRTRLFRPFDSTKGDRGMGIGAYEVREFVRKSRGDVAVHSTPGQGTRFVISLPLAPAVSTPATALSDERQYT